MGKRNFLLVDAGIGIVCDLQATDSCLTIACSITNESEGIMRNAYVQNCLRFPKAPNFSDKVGETVYFRRDGTWVPMSSTKHWFEQCHRSVANTTKFYFREDTLPFGRQDTEPLNYLHPQMGPAPGSPIKMAFPGSILKSKSRVASRRMSFPRISGSSLSRSSGVLTGPS